MEQQLSEAKYNQVLLGSLLTKGGIRQRSKSLVYYEKQPRALLSYAQWKCGHLGLSTAKIIGLEDPVLLEGKDVDVLPVMRDWFYWEDDHKRHIPRSLGQTLGYLGLLVAYLDCGTVLGPHHVGIRFVGFSREDLQRLVDAFNNTHNLSLYLSKENKSWRTGTQSNKIIIDKKNINTLLPIWSELIRKHDLPPVCLDCVQNLALKPGVCEDLSGSFLRCCIVCQQLKNLDESNFIRIDKKGFGFTCRMCVGQSTYSRKLSQKDLKSFLEKLVDKNNSQIAKLLGVSRQRVHFLRHKFGIKNPAVVDTPTTREEKDLLSAQRARFRCKKYNCRQRKISFTLNFVDIQWPTHCSILGIELDYFAEKKQDNSPSFDKIDPKLGYSKDNVLIISSKANTVRHKGTAEEHRKIADYIDKCVQATVG